MISPERLQKIREQFRSEVEKHLEAIELSLRSRQAAETDRQAVQNMADHLHAVKGSAPLLAAWPISEVARAAEECVLLIKDDPSFLTAETSMTLHEAFAFMRQQVRDFTEGREVQEGREVIQRILSALPEGKRARRGKPEKGEERPAASLLGEVDAVNESEVQGGKAGKILFVDDSQISRDLYKIFFFRHGFQIELAGDGDEALERLREGGFDAVITDDQMPNMNGMDLLRTVRRDSALRSMPVIMISGKANEEAREAALKEGATTYLVKGNFAKDELLEILKGTLNKGG